MVDFAKLRKRKEAPASLDPYDIFQTLDKKTGKDELRASQKGVLSEWFSDHRGDADVVVKLHTGQGKTLVGLLMLLSTAKETGSPVLYLCPNNHLVDQTLHQASDFGVPAVSAEAGGGPLPASFLNGQSILVANYNLLFNGRSRFGVVGSGKDPISLGGIVLDDAHRGIEIIRSAFAITLRKTSGGDEARAYDEILTLFKESLERQGAGTYKNIQEGESRLLAVPFWSWRDKRNDALTILNSYRENVDAIGFPWDLLKDRLSDCICLITGRELEIFPRITPVQALPSFSGSPRRIYLSATLTEDSYLVRDLGVRPEAVTRPLSRGDVPYSGERLVLLPSLVNPDARRNHILAWFCEFAKKHPELGSVAIVPSTAKARDWEVAGARVPHRDDIEDILAEFSADVNKRRSNRVLVLNNRYDGVDLPDDICRVLCLDSIPGHTTLWEWYQSIVRRNSKDSYRRIAQRVEQGMGRGIRGSSDYCVIIVAGDDLTSFLTVAGKRAHFSPEVNRQIETGLHLVGQIQEQGRGTSATEQVVLQVLRRETDWKEYYNETMENLPVRPPVESEVETAGRERAAELNYLAGRYAEAVEDAQWLIDKSQGEDKGWYLQMKAMYLDKVDRRQAMDAQLTAWRSNPQLLKPEEGIEISKKIPAVTRRGDRIRELIAEFRNWAELVVEVRGRLDFSFGVSSEVFEDGVEQLGRLLGFESTRPERDLKVGPDNLWRSEGNWAWLIECKNEVAAGTGEISQDYCEQLSNSAGWFQDRYGFDPVAVSAHPATTMAARAFPPCPVYVLDPARLQELVSKIEGFYLGLKDTPLANLDAKALESRLSTAGLSTDKLMGAFLVRAKKDGVKR
jgi:hypothetical protein